MRPDDLADPPGLPHHLRVDVEPPPGNPPLGAIKLLPVDYDYIEKESKSLKNRFAEIFQ